MRLRPWLVGLLCCLAVRVVAQPRADAALPAARPHVEAAARHFAAKEFARAADELRLAYRLDPQPRFLYAIAQALRRGGNCAGATPWYREFLRTEPPDPQATAARQNLALCEAQARTRPPPVEGLASPAAQGEAPAARVAVTPPAPRPQVPRPWFRDALGDALSIAGVLALATGGVVLKLGNDDVGGARATGSYGGFDAQVARGQTLQQAGGVTMAVGGALVAAGIVRFLVRSARTTDESRVAVSAAPTRGGGLLMLGRSF